MTRVLSITGRLWYATKVIILNIKEFDKIANYPDINNFKDKSLFSGVCYKIPDNINNMFLSSYGVVDDHIIITVY